MRTYCQSDFFDVAFNLYTSFGYFRDLADDICVLRNFFTSLKPGGRFVIDLMSRDLFFSKLPSQVRKEQADGSVMLSEHRFIEQESWLENTWTHIAKGRRNEAKMGLRLYSREELCRLLLDVGFVGLEIYGDLDGRAYDDHANHLVIVAKKPDTSYR